MKVLTHIAGSVCVVQINNDCYIDARRDVRQPNASFIELVRSGQVRKKIACLHEEAPEIIIKWLKSL